MTPSVLTALTSASASLASRSPWPVSITTQASHEPPHCVRSDARAAEADQEKRTMLLKTHWAFVA